MAKPGPLIALAAGAAFLLMRKGEAAPEPIIIPEEDIPPPPPTAPKYEPSPPCIANCVDGYDVQLWNSRTKILNAFDALGYKTPDDRDTMNALGADGKLGGDTPADRDVASAVVEAFQRAYNKVSRGNKLDRSKFGGNRPMGLLRPDGYVGPRTLNGLQMVIANAPDNVATGSVEEMLGGPRKKTISSPMISWWKQLSA